jgi:carboxynorspermidine decarboxylase
MNIETYEGVSCPMYVIEEKRLRGNLSVISKIANEAGVEFILAFKAFALWKTFPVFREYIRSTTASSLFEARLAYEEFGQPAHVYSPAYTARELPELVRYASHLTFNSLSQYAHHADNALHNNPELSLGIRINPESSEIETLLYNPCAPGSRFGITADQLSAQLPKGIEGFHCHCHCESGADVFERTLRHIEEKFSPWFPQLKWINFGGGHLVTRKDYDRQLLVRVLLEFRQRYPWLKVFMEPGSAFAWQTGPLIAQVVDIVENKGIKTAILNVSFTCHMPDCLEMPYMPAVRGAEIVDSDEGGTTVYRLGGCSCLSGDFLGNWRFDHELQIGENIIFEDMIHYTTVKTTMFNGVAHPDIYMATEDGRMELLRHYTYEDYRDRMD